MSARGKILPCEFRYRPLVRTQRVRVDPRLPRTKRGNSSTRLLGKSSLTRSRAGVRHALRNPAFADLAQEARLLTIARTILGADARPFHATLFEKAHHANWLVMWYQDTALPLRRRSATPGWGPWSVKEGVVYAHAPASSLERGLAIRIHLDASNPDNGPLRVLPGTHTSGVPTDDAIHELTKSRDR